MYKICKNYNFGKRMTTPAHFLESCTSCRHPNDGQQNYAEFD